MVRPQCNQLLTDLDQWWYSLHYRKLMAKHLEYSERCRINRLIKSVNRARIRTIERYNESHILKKY
jgi:hypothetical protein